MLGNLDDIIAELIGLCASVLLIAGYALYRRQKSRNNKYADIQSVNDRARSTLVCNVMKGQAEGVLAVQTLRNSTMAAVFLASTSILLIMAVVHLGTGGFKGTLEYLKLTDSSNHTLITILIFPLLIDLFWAFFCFTLAIRAYTHVGYLINARHKSFMPMPNYVARVLNQGAGYCTLGVRAYCFMIPLIFGLFSPVYMVVVTAVILFVLHSVDRAPVDHEQIVTDSPDTGMSNREVLREINGGESS